MEARRLIKQGAVRVLNEDSLLEKWPLEYIDVRPGESDVFKIGKRRWLRVAYMGEGRRNDGNSAED